MSDITVEHDLSVVTGGTAKRRLIRSHMREVAPEVYAPVIALQPAGEALTLLDAADATGDGVAWPGGKGVMFVNGTWDGATAALEWSDDGSTWWSLGSGYSLTDDGLVHFELPAGEIRAAISSAGTTALDATAKAV